MKGKSRGFIQDIKELEIGWTMDARFWLGTA